MKGEFLKIQEQAIFLIILHDMLHIIYFFSGLKSPVEAHIVKQQGKWAFFLLRSCN